MMTNSRSTYNEDEFLDTVDVYSAYQALNNLDLIEDIILRVNVNENELGEIEEALGEVARLVREARDFIEVLTGDHQPDDPYWVEGSDDEDEEGRDE